MTVEQVSKIKADFSCPLQLDGAERKQWLKRHSAGAAMANFGFALPIGGNPNRGIWPVVKMVHGPNDVFASSIVGCVPPNLQFKHVYIPERTAKLELKPVIYTYKDELGFAFPKYPIGNSPTMAIITPFMHTDDFALTTGVSEIGGTVPMLVVANESSTMIFINAPTAQNLPLAKLHLMDEDGLAQYSRGSLLERKIHLPTGAQLLEMFNTLGLA
ncbi:MAG: hypothetical protein NUV65_02710 [Candidatus Roizmanbacteria bacterium]|nr:hypothetical protein [Candidatus Roizmanbacteria bacterium]